MPYVFRFNDAEAAELKDRAAKVGQSLPDYVRAKLFPHTASIVTVSNTINRALAKEPGSEFTVPELYKQAEYAGVNRGVAGSVGREFNREVIKSYADEIQPIGQRNRQALYRRL